MLGLPTVDEMLRGWQGTGGLDDLRRHVEEVYLEGGRPPVAAG
jgi:hypothetical protein